MNIEDASRPLDGASVSAFLSRLPVRPNLLGLGEARHFVGEVGEVRNQVFRHLVEHEGYRSLAVESDCLMGMIVDDYVTTGTGTLDEVMRSGFSHNFGSAPGNRELVEWMRAYNSSHDEKLRFFGFDGPLEYWAASPREALTALNELLGGPFSFDELLGPDERWSNPDTVMDPSQSIGQSADAQRLRVIADDLVALLDTRAPGLAVSDLEKAELYGRTAVGLLRYHHWMADTSPERISRLSGLRDAMMAANLLAIAARGPALVYTHNLHLQRTRSVMSLGEHQVEMWSAGAILSARLGNRFAYLATAFGAIGDDVPPPDTAEGMLSTLPWEAALVDPRAIAGAVPRVSTDFAYFPLDPATLDTIDGLVFLQKVDDVRSPG